MATSPNTQSIIDQIVSYLQAVQWNGQNLFLNVVEGGLNDFTNMATTTQACAMVTIKDGPIKRVKSGGGTQNIETFLVTCVVPTSDQAQAEKTIVACYMYATQPFLQHAYLGGLSNVKDSRVKEDSPTFFWTQINGVDWRMFSFEIEVVDEYFVTVTS